MDDTGLLEGGGDGPRGPDESAAGGRAGAPAALVRVLRREGPLTLAALAAEVGLSRTAVMYHLRNLARSGLVQKRPVRHGVGRPHDVYDVTPLARSLPPTDYRGLAESLVEAVREIGGRGLESRMFEERRRGQLAAVRARIADRGLTSAPIYERACELARFLDELGHESTVERRGAVRITQHHCPIIDVAASSPAACEAELRLIADALDAGVTRETHIASGARSCTYRVHALGWDSRGWDVSQYVPQRAEPGTPRAAADGHARPAADGRARPAAYAEAARTLAQPGRDGDAERMSSRSTDSIVTSSEGRASR